eukprot:364865-Chlamydomonas_euryale.AAC.1
MLLDYCPGGDLKGYIRRWGRVSERVGKSFMRQVADGMAELRLHKIVHVSASPTLCWCLRCSGGSGFRAAAWRIGMAEHMTACLPFLSEAGEAVSKGAT